MGEETIRWTIEVAKETDLDLRTFLAEQGLSDGDLPKYVERAVRRMMFEETLAEFRKGFKDMTSDEVEALVDEAVAWARANPDE
ncbi:MAG: hypothetical protein JF595_09125 [Sphingomonadales bacterium]|nr:hypothetical protein [Sphingomonadales bacterium]